MLIISYTQLKETKALDIDLLVNTVQQNCHISDARHAGNYTMCIFLLKMREYYRWEQGLPYSSPLSQQDVGDWLLQREQSWESLEDNIYQPIPLSSQEVDPFDTNAINQELIPQGYIYSSGYGTYSKPHFFLGNLQQQETRDGITIFHVTSEYARDMDAPPAMLCDKQIFIRMESVRRFIWERIEEWRWKENVDTPMGRVLKAIDTGQDDEAILDQLMAPVTEIMVQHELGEAQAGTLLGPDWESMLGSIHDRKVELMLRAARDNLADCMNTLPFLISEPQAIAMHFYFSNFHGLRKSLFPQLLQQYQEWCQHGDNTSFASFTSKAQQHWQRLCLQILDMYQKKNDEAVTEIDNLLTSHAGITL